MCDAKSVPYLEVASLSEATTTAVETAEVGFDGLMDDGMGLEVA